MKLIMVLFIVCVGTWDIQAQWGYKHKPEEKIATMTPSQRVDEWIKENLYHIQSGAFFGADPPDIQSDIIKKYVRQDGFAALPRIIEVIDAYDPTSKSGRSNHKPEKYQAVMYLLEDIDNRSIRLRSSEEGKRAMTAIERAIPRMRAAGYEKTPDSEWTWKTGLLEMAQRQLEQAKDVNFTDETVRDTLRFVYKVFLSDADILEFSNFLTDRYPQYPTWRGDASMQIDKTKIAPDGLPTQIVVLKKPEKFYDAYLEFKKGRSN